MFPQDDAALRLQQEQRLLAALAALPGALPERLLNALADLAHDLETEAVVRESAGQTLAYVHMLERE